MMQLLRLAFIIDMFGASSGRTTAAVSVASMNTKYNPHSGDFTEEEVNPLSIADLDCYKHFDTFRGRSFASSYNKENISFLSSINAEKIIQIWLG